MKLKTGLTIDVVGQSCRSAGPLRDMAAQDLQETLAPHQASRQTGRFALPRHPATAREWWGELSERALARRSRHQLPGQSERLRCGMALLRSHAVTVLLLLIGTALQAGIPQPMFIYYGQAKDGFGIPYRDKAEVVLIKDGTDIARSTINGSRVPGVNFALYAHLDNGQGDSTYVSKAVRTGDLVSIVVRDQYGQKTIMEQAVVPPVGKPGEQTSINVTAAVDVDGDLLPDQWENEMVYWAGDLNSIYDVNAGDDYDGDGQTNGDEYRAGTFAFLDYDYFFAEQMAVTANGRFEITFWGVPGKVYSAEHKTALADGNWISTPVATSDTGEFQSGPVEGKGNWLSLYLSKDEAMKFFRFTVK